MAYTLEIAAWLRLAYNTVDRLLRGDLFHTVTVQDVLHDLGRFDAGWPVVGIGTTATVWPLDDFVMQIHNVGRAMNPVKAS